MKEEEAAALGDQQLKESLQQEKRRFAWACIWMALAAIALAGFFFAVHWEKRQLSALLLGPPDELKMGRVVALQNSAERWRAVFLIPWLFFSLAFTLSMGSWLLSIRKRRMRD